MLFALTNTGGANIMPNLPMLPHRTPRALCGSVEKNADSLVKGMTLCAQVGGGRGGGKRSWSKSRPPVSPWSACIFVVVALRIFSDIFAVIGGNLTCWTPDVSQFSVRYEYVLLAHPAKARR